MKVDSGVVEMAAMSACWPAARSVVTMGMMMAMWTGEISARRMAGQKVGEWVGGMASWRG